MITDKKLSQILTKPIKFVPNVRFEDAAATTGYTWGKPASESNILKLLPPEVAKELKIANDALVAERWLCCDDQQFSSQIELTKKDRMSWRELLDLAGDKVLGILHTREFGNRLNCVMKQLDTNTQVDKGALSVQLHPAANHLKRPTKPEMWIGTGSVYLGWKKDMTRPAVEASVTSGKLEQYLNLITLDGSKGVVVPGGTVHAIRSNTFLFEWSKAPGQDDEKKGGLKDATIALYDRTDGKTPRPGKEDLVNSMEVMTHAKTFGRTDLSSALLNPTLISQREGFRHYRSFTTASVFVEKWEISSSAQMNLTTRGLPIYVAEGMIEIWHKQEKVADVPAGTELFLPHLMESVELRAIRPSIVYTWFAPTSIERRAVGLN